MKIAGAKCRLWTTVIVLALLVACQSKTEVSTSRETTFSIIAEESTSNEKASIDIRLSEEVPDTILESIAWQLRRNGRSQFKRLFVSYYLPNMNVGEGAWATSHFRPQLEVRILGFTAKPGASQLSKTGDLPGSLGLWHDPVIGATYQIVETGGNHSLFQSFTDGSESERRLKMTTFAGETRFQILSSKSNDYFVIDAKSGALRIYDHMGLIAELEPVGE